MWGEVDVWLTIPALQTHYADPSAPAATAQSVNTHTKHVRAYYISREHMFTEETLLK